MRSAVDPNGRLAHCRVHVELENLHFPVSERRADYVRGSECRVGSHQRVNKAVDLSAKWFFSGSQLFEVTERNFTSSMLAYLFRMLLA